MKRFWDEARVVEHLGSFAIRLDGRPMRLPGGPLLALQSRALAEQIAAEWQTAGGEKNGVLTADDVPLTRIAGTAQERVAPDPAPTARALARYAEADVICYRADGPESLVSLEARCWDPWLDWARDTYDAELLVVRGVMPADQSPAALAAMARALDPRPAFELAGLGILVPALGSLVLGLAVADGALPAAEAHRLALLDELFQAEQWGEDREAISRRRALLHDIETAARFIELSRDDAGRSAAGP